MFWTITIEITITVTSFNRKQPELFMWITSKSAVSYVSPHTLI